MDKLDKEAWIAQAIEAEERRHKVVMSALNDKAFMDQTFESYKEHLAGVPGVPLEEIKRRQGIV